MLKPTPGVKPDMRGVPGVICDSAPPDVLFGSRRHKTSPYDPLLLQLQRSGAGKFLRFEDRRAKVSIVARAKKLNIKVLFGEQGDTLWVTLAKVELSSNGHSEPQQQPKARPLAEIILEGIRDDKRDTPGLMVSYARLHGAPDVTLNAVDRVVSDLARGGKVKLKPARNKMDSDERWIAV